MQALKVPHISSSADGYSSAISLSLTIGLVKTGRAAVETTMLIASPSSSVKVDMRRPTLMPTLGFKSPVEQ